MFEAYADESGIHGDAQVCIVCGYVGGDGQWRCLETEWSQILASYHVQDFHAKEFWTRKPTGKLTGQYKHLSPNQGFRLIRDLVNIVLVKKVHLIGGAVNIEDFNSLTEKERKFITGGLTGDGNKWVSSGAPSKPYFLPFQSCLVESINWTPSGQKVGIAFDQQKQYMKRAIETYRESYLVLDDEMSKKMDLIVFAERHEAAGLQLADLSAYLWYRYRTGKFNSEQEEILHSLSVKGDRLTSFNKEAFDTILGRLPTEVRRSLREKQSHR
ncbi:DUF3800 domain-containing protein [Acidobacteria bacterium AH-259-G07]|nr:DUF3800 domain-containing protein [Acidobacteria bacterium AH-259-G07]